MKTSTQSCLQVQRTGAIGLTVADIDRATQFYTQVFGFEKISDYTVCDRNPDDHLGKGGFALRRVVLSLGEESIQLMAYPTLAGQPIPPDSRSNDLWFQHFAIVVSDMDAAYAHLQNFSINPISSAPQTFPPGNLASAHIRAFKFRDPEGHNLEILWFPPDKGQAKWHQSTDRVFLGIDHSAITVGDTQDSLLFYRDLLGMQVEGRSFNWRELQAKLDDLPDATVQVTTLRAPHGGIGIELLDYLKPGKGRQFPLDWQRNDIAHIHIELKVEDFDQAIHQLKQHNFSCIPVELMPHGNTEAYDRGMLVKDPSGHSLLLQAA